MPLAKFLVSTALLAAPLAIASGQSTSPPDSGSSHQNGKWIAGAAAAAGATVFLAFTHSGNTAGNPHNAFVPATPTTPTSGPGSPPVAGPPTGGGNPPPSGNQPDSTQPPADSGAQNSPAPQDTSSIFNPTNPDAPPSGLLINPPSGPPNGPPNGNRPRENSFLANIETTTTSTVPEPGSLALTATGIIGLLPLVRRRRR